MLLSRDGGGGVAVVLLCSNSQLELSAPGSFRKGASYIRCNFSST